MRAAQAELALVVARAQADQGHTFYSSFLDELTTTYRDFFPDADPQDRRSVWMKESLTEISHEEALALLTIAIDRLTQEKR